MRKWLKDHREPVLFYLAALFFLGWRLGTDPLWGSEDRWAEIAREMWMTGDWFHPAINGTVYFDKPLLSYWPIVFLAKCFGFMNEWTVRIPSLLAALAALWGTRDLARRITDCRTARYAGWLLLSCYGFFFWGRTAAADMLNLAVVIVAVDWFCARKENAGFFSYFLFYLICCVGALAKGLPALILPPLIVLAWVIADGSWKKHLVWQNFLALPPALLIAAAQFVLAAKLPMVEWYTQQANGLSGLELVWRENVLRVFQPFDHNDEPWCSYFWHVPRILLPWSPLLLFALIAAVRDWKKLAPARRWLWLAAAVIFVLFSASGSRRWYYILPILPFLAIAIAAWIGEAGLWTRPVALGYRWLLGIAAAAVLIVLLPGLTLLRFTGFFGVLTGLAGGGTVLLAVAVPAAMLWCCVKRSGWGGVVAAGMIGIFLVFGEFYPVFGALRTEKEFAMMLREELPDGPHGCDRVIFFLKDAPKVVFYCEAERPFRVAPNEAALKRLLAGMADGEPVYLIAENRGKTLERLKKALPDLDTNAPDLKESSLAIDLGENYRTVSSSRVLPLEKPKSRKLCCWKLFPAVPAK